MAPSYLSSVLPFWFLQEPTIFIPKTNHQSKAPSPATAHSHESITAQNVETSALCRLPAELLLIIADYLPNPLPSSNTAIMACRATCRRFYFLLPGPTQSIGQTKWPPSDRRAYSRMSRRDAFRRICAEERNKKGHLLLHSLPANEVQESEQDSIVCGMCQSTHARSCFTIAEQNKKPESRVCIGSSGVLELCPHVRIGYHAMKAKMGIVCERDHYFVLGKSGTVRVVRAEGGEVKVEVELCMESNERKKRESKRGWTNRMILKAMKNTEWRLCPHMNTRDIDKWLSLDGIGSLYPDTPSCTITCGFGMWCSGEHKISWPVHACKKQDCNTRYTLMWDKRSIFQRKETEVLVLKIERFLGRMKSADDRRWMSQIVEASGHEEDRL